MLELAHAVLERVEAGGRVAVVTVTHVFGSAPRALGSSMAVDPEGRAIGSISGGCVEAQAYALAQEVLGTSVASGEHFGFDDEAAFAAGLSCGGQLRVFGQIVDSGSTAVLAELRAARAGRSAALAIVVGGPSALVGLVLTGATRAQDVLGPQLDEDTVRRILAERQARLVSGRSATVEIDCQGVELEVSFVVHAEKPRLLIFGAVDFSAALCSAGALLGYRVSVCDARPVFATSERFPGADEIVVGWPSDYLVSTPVDARTVIAVLTHDEKFDIPLLETALTLPVAYVGAMGSRRTHERRLRLLREAGVAEDALARLHSPIGLDIGASTPEETAVSILAEVLAARTGASGEPLAGRSGPIHAAH
ncbi:XdhC family protein [Rathayibacter tanaceti]|uniref:Xanthine dehydrogenase accessory factor n=2 Tax=Rathayibacter tanaceti TaxID=1671680 RepID=A0ACD2XNS3_9MICO|nr:XdhC/CoxI family protein [Rathayibacter tanaceti]KZX20583.1 putative xanthine dehydrogenase subunit A [Rathayibacter tanaceti]QHC55655.1 XdhC/CoxI family protein [Rathayibacter tanaceti]TCO39542.1 xanthine dehydrogenase accessory factor [Rathayibacter tanaceti]